MKRREEKAKNGTNGDEANADPQISPIPSHPIRDEPLGFSSGLACSPCPHVHICMYVWTEFADYGVQKLQMGGAGEGDGMVI